MTVDEIEAFGERVERFLAPFLAALPGGRGRGEGCTRANFEAYFRGLLSGLERKSVEPIALAAGIDERALQLFLSKRPWDHDGLRDALQRHVAAKAPDLLELAVIDETSHVKKGDQTPGVQRQWCGTRGKVDNCIVTVHLAGARADGRTAVLLDSALFVPQSWDAARRRQAAMPTGVKPQPKWQLALDQHARAAANGLRFAWLAADEGYGSKPAFLAELVTRRQAFAVEVPKTFRGWTAPPLQMSSGVPKPKTAANLARHSSAGGGWNQYHVKDTAKGATAWEVRRLPFGFRCGKSVVGGVELLMARNLRKPAEVKYFVVFDPSGAASERAKMRAAFGRPAVEGCFQKAKGETGLSHYEGRKYDGLLRHCHLSALALAFLELETGRRRRGKKASGTGGDGAATPPRAGRAAGPTA